MRVLFLFVLFLTSLFSNEKLEKVALQLQWLDQFQFAGYYIAKEKGFYENVGLDVDIKSFTMGINPVEEVLSGRAQYATGRTSLIIDKSEGKNLFLMSAILQSSPLVLVSKKSSGIENIKDFKGKRVSLEGTQTSVDIFGMLSSRGINESDMKIIHTKDKLKSFVDGDVDIISAYTSNQVYILEKQGIALNIFNPKDYGFNFYSDILFTSDDEYSNHHKRVHDFNLATLRGWEYAFSHGEETVDLILKKYNTQDKTREDLLYEANELKELAYYDTKVLGQIRKEQVEKIYDIYRIMGFINNEIDFDEFILDADRHILHLSTKEKEWLKNHPVMTYSEVDWKPLSIIEDNQMKGIFGDFLDLVSQRTAIVFKFIPSDSWTDVLEKFKNKEIDFVPSNPQDLDLGLVSDVYKKYPMVIVTGNKYKYVASLDDLAEKVVAVPKYYSSYNYIIEKYPNIKLLPTKDIPEALKLVEEGRADAFVGHIANSLYYLSDLHLTNLKVAGITNFEFKHSYLIQRDYPEFLSIINKVFASITAQEKAKIYANWASAKIVQKVDYTLVWQLLAVSLGIIGFFLYINRRLDKSNRELEKQKELYNVVFENTSFGVLIIDAETHKFVDCNAQILKMLDYDSRKEILTLNLADISPKFQPNGKESFKKAEDLMNFAMQKGSLTFEWKHKKSTGEEFWVEVILTHIILDGKDVIYATWKDIDKRKLMEVELREKDELMIAQSRHAAMGEMISMIAHQWRQPLSVISMSANNIILDVELDTIDKVTLEENANDILEYTLYLSQTIDDFRDFFRPNKEKNEISVEEIIHEAHKIMGKSFENNHIRISITSHCHCVVLTHSRELLQVFINLLKNAKEAYLDKKDDTQEVTILIEGSEDMVVTTICDNAGGINEEIINKIFEPYFSTKDEKTGTGLGLYMSKTIVEKHLGGTITVSNKNNGACFEVRIPK